MPQQFGWAHVFEGAVTSSLGPTGSLQFKIGAEAISGSAGLLYETATNTLIVSGSGNALEVTGSAYVKSGFAGMLVMGNQATVDTDVTIPSSYNCLLMGPITIASGASITISTDSILKIHT